MEQTQIVALIYEHMGKPQDRTQMERLALLVEAAAAAEHARWRAAAALAHEALCLDAGGDAQILRERLAIRALAETLGHG